MVKKRVRAADTWKTKQWFTVLAPKIFNEKEVGQTAAQEPEMVIGRRVEVLGTEVTGSLSHLQYLLTFRITSVTGSKAFTEFEGYELERSFVKRLTRRHTSKIETVFDVNTRDGKTLHIKVFVWTAVKVSRGKMTDIRKKVESFIRDIASKTDKDVLLKEFFAGDIMKRLSEQLKKIAPIKRAEVAKVRVVSSS